MTQTDEQVRELPLRRDGNPLRPRLLRDEIAVHKSGFAPYRYPNGAVGWVTTTSEAFRFVLGDPRFHARWFNGAPQLSPVNVEVPDMPGFIPSMNGPEHLRVRRLAAGDFSVKRINELRPYITQVVDAQLDLMLAKTPPVDLIEEFCLPVPSTVIGHILGVPRENGPDFERAARETIGGRSDGAEDATAAARAVVRLHQILGEVIDEKRRNPGDDLISRLTTAGDPPLSDDEIKGLCTNLLMAGHDTTAANTAMAVAYLYDDPKQRDAFVADPERIPAAVEELVRFNNVVSDGAQIPRVAMEDVEVGGVHIRKGDYVMPSVALANTDADICPAGGTELDITRPPGLHLSFGYGAHACLGQHLARAELQIMLGRLFERVPTLALVKPSADLDWNADAFVYRMSTLPVTW